MNTKSNGPSWPRLAWRQEAETYGPFPACLQHAGGNNLGGKVLPASKAGRKGPCCFVARWSDHGDLITVIWSRWSVGSPKRVSPAERWSEFAFFWALIHFWWRRSNSSNIYFSRLLLSSTIRHRRSVRRPGDFEKEALSIPFASLHVRDGNSPLMRRIPSPLCESNSLPMPENKFSPRTVAAVQISPRWTKGKACDLH